MVLQLEPGYLGSPQNQIGEAKTVVAVAFNLNGDVTASDMKLIRVEG